LIVAIREVLQVDIILLEERVRNHSFFLEDEMHSRRDAGVEGFILERVGLTGRVEDFHGPIAGYFCCGEIFKRCGCDDKCY